MRKILILLGILALVFLFLLWRTTRASATVTHKVNLCHCERPDSESPFQCQTLHLAPPAAFTHLKEHDADYLGQCKEPEVTPTVTPTPTPIVECEDDCEPSVTPTPTETPEVTPTPEIEVHRDLTPAGPRQGPDCVSPTWAPTLTYQNGTFSWTTVKDAVHSYWFQYGPTKDNLPYAVMVNGESFKPIVEWKGNIWAKVAASDQGCLSPFSLVVDP